MAEEALSLADYLRLPETEPPAEYRDGRVVEKPPLVGRDRWLRADLAALLYGWARASRHGAVASEARCTFGGSSFLLDVVYFAPEHLPRAGEPLGRPDLALEVCPREVDPAWVGAKLAQMVALGVRLAWLVDPLEESATVYRPGHEPVVLDQGGMLDGAEVLPGFYLHLADLFAVLNEEDEPS